MKIESIEATALEIPLPRQFATVVRKIARLSLPSKSKSRPKPEPKPPAGRRPEHRAAQPAPAPAIAA